jgi:hypothetical protein
MDEPAVVRDVACRSSVARPASIFLVGCLARAMLAVVAATPVAATTLDASTSLRVPPPALEERLPPLPGRGSFTWQPGSWRWTGIAGAEWEWQSGHYVSWPRRRAAAPPDQAPSTSRGWAGIGDDRQ